MIEADGITRDKTKTIQQGTLALSIVEVVSKALLYVENKGENIDEHPFADGLFGVVARDLREILS